MIVWRTKIGNAGRAKFFTAKGKFNGFLLWQAYSLRSPR